MSTIARPILPTFFLAGAPKAGTTSLYHHLRRHPEIYMSPVKEPRYFSLESRLENVASREQGPLRQKTAAQQKSKDHFESAAALKFIQSWEEYVDLFADARGAKAIGEASADYLWSRTAAREIAARMPCAKILLILRHPAERAFSQYAQARVAGHVSHSFRDHIAEGLRAPHDKISIYHPFLDAGFYSEQVERYFACFPREQVRVWLYEDTRYNPSKFLREVLTFLGVNPNLADPVFAGPSFDQDVEQRPDEVQAPEARSFAESMRRASLWRTVRGFTPGPMRPMLKRFVLRKHGPLRMSEDDRQFLVEYYHDDIKRLERLIERDLSHWLR